ncbi:lectin subunit alpha [Stomoxys calcitrans]|uniref:lectin subunit alpha n=1 Tax=Stomoxys calcitrans TaxID=35570 RepID=UPI0027E2FEE3|nr:lectin subunit alpha [Stomoxys calcitrans]
MKAPKFLFLYLLLTAVYFEVWAGNHYQTPSGVAYYIEPMYQFNWFEAYFECSYRNMSLYTIKNIEQFHDLHSLLMSGKFNDKPPNLWIGGIGLKSKFFWVKTQQPMTFDDLWAPNNPDNANEMEHCLQIWSRKRYLNDLNCELKIGFVCESNSEDHLTAMAHNEGKYRGLTINLYQNNRV